MTHPLPLLGAIPPDNLPDWLAWDKRILSTKADMAMKHSPESEERRERLAAGHQAESFWNVMEAHAHTHESAVKFARTALRTAVLLSDATPAAVQRLTPGSMTPAAMSAYQALTGSHPLLARMSKLSAIDFSKALLCIEHPSLHLVLRELLGEVLDVAR